MKKTKPLSVTIQPDLFHIIAGTGQAGGSVLLHSACTEYGSCSKVSILQTKMEIVNYWDDIIKYTLKVFKMENINSTFSIVLFIKTNYRGGILASLLITNFFLSL